MIIEADERICLDCIRNATDLKVKIVAGYIREFLDNASKLCQSLDDEELRAKCYYELGMKAWDLEYLSTHTVRKFCEWIKKCPEVD